AYELSAVRARLVAARRVLGQVVAVGRVGAAAAATAELAELARAAAAAERALAEIGKDLRALPELCEARLPEIAGRDRHVGARGHVARRRDAAVVLPGRAGAVGVVGEEGGRGVEPVENPSEVGRALRADEEPVRPADRHAPGILAPLEDGVRRGVGRGLPGS